MDSSPNTDRLLDLLYGELSTEASEALYREIEEDEDLAEQWRKLQVIHDDVHRAVPPPQDMPREVSDAILEAASQNTTDKAQRRDQNGAPIQGGWKKLLSPQAMAIASTVAIVCGVGLMLFADMQGLSGDSQQQVDRVSVGSPFEDGVSMSPPPPSQPASEPIPESAGSAPVDDSHPGGEQETAPPEVAQRPQQDTDPDQESEDRPDETEELLAMGDRTEQDRQPTPQRRERRPAARSSSSPEPEPEPEPLQHAAPQEGTIDLFDDGGDLQGAGRGGGAIGAISDEPRPAAETDALAPEADDDRADDAPENDAELLLAQARRAAADGDVDRARALVERLVDDDDLDDDLRQQVLELDKHLESGDQ